MTQRPKTPLEIANELPRETNPRQQLSELGKVSHPGVPGWALTLSSPN
jgi:hypothetical protein